MTEHSHAVFEAPLVRVDHLLREIQVALVPDREPAPPAIPAATPAPPARPEAQEEPQPEPQLESPRGRRAGPLAEMLERARREPPAPEREPKPAKSGCCGQELTEELNALGDLRSQLEQLRVSLGELLAGYQGALVRALAAPVSSPSPSPTGPTVGHEFTVVAGPFVRLEAVQAFERALQALPGIEQVAIRGYEGADRAIVDVRLTEPNS